MVPSLHGTFKKHIVNCRTRANAGLLANRFQRTTARFTNRHPRWIKTSLYRAHLSGTVCPDLVLVHRLAPLLPRFFQTSPRGFALVLRYHFVRLKRTVKGTFTLELLDMLGTPPPQAAALLPARFPRWPGEASWLANGVDYAATIT
jgi:hypothetical protein